MPVSVSLKGLLGYTLGASGAMEISALIGCLAKGFAPATAGFASLDEECAISPTMATQCLEAKKSMFNFVGFGGGVYSLLLERTI